MLREPHGSYCGMGHLRHITRMLYAVLVMLFVGVVAFPVAPAAWGTEIDSTGAVPLEQMQDGDSASQAKPDSVQEQLGGDGELATGEGDSAAENAQAMERESSQANTEETEKVEGTEGTEEEAEAAEEPQSNNEDAQEPVTSTGSANSDVGSISAASVGFDPANDDRIFEIPGVALMEKDRSSSTKDLFKEVLTEQYSVAITNDDRSQLMVAAPQPDGFRS